MPLAIVTALGGVALNMLFKLLTERFLTRALLIGMREAAKRTDAVWDDQLVSEMEKALDGAAVKPAA